MSVTSGPHYANNLLSVDAIDTLNDARTILRECADVLSNVNNAPEGTRSVDVMHAGRVAEVASHAEHSVFELLNAVNAYLDAKLPDDLLMNKRESEYRLWVNSMRTVLVRRWATGLMEVCFREDNESRVWGPPVRVAQEA